MEYKVGWSKKVQKQLDRIPEYIRDKFLAWALVVEKVGLSEARKSPGFHDEPLRGDRKGQRSIRLSKAYRAIYVEQKGGTITIVEVLEVNKHEY